MIYLGIDQEQDERLGSVLNVDLNTAVHIKPWPEDHGDVVVPVAPWTRYVAIDDDGVIHCYSEKPKYIEQYHGWFLDERAMARYCGEVGLEGWSFKASESCVEVKL